MEVEPGAVSSLYGISAVEVQDSPEQERFFAEPGVAIAGDFPFKR